VSSIFKKTGVVADVPIAIGTSILSTPISIVSGELFPGEGGHMRCWFSIITSDGLETSIAATINNNFTTGEFFFNANNDFRIKSGALYWFDIPIEEGDNVNLRSINSPDSNFSAKIITAIKLLRFQKIVFGA